MKQKKTDSGADAPEQKKETVFITIFLEDRDWVNKTKGKLTRAERLHQIVEFYKTRTAGYVKADKKGVCGICGLPREDHIPSRPGNVPRAGACLFAEG